MELSFTKTGTAHTARVSALSKLNAGVLVGVALVLCYLSIAFFGFEVVSVVIIGICLACAGLNLTGWRWASLPGLLPGVVIPALFGSFLLRDPSAPPFLPGLLLVGCGALVGISGIAATVQNYRRPASERRLPRWAVPVVALVIGLVLGAALTALAPRPAMSAGISAEVLAEFPALAATNFQFDQREIRVKVGETVALRLENGDPEAHSFDVDELNVHAPMPVGQTGVALFEPTKPGSYIFYCAPHYNKATGEGMYGTLIVEP